jgi:hypothetical protein
LRHLLEKCYPSRPLGVGRSYECACAFSKRGKPLALP